MLDFWDVIYAHPEDQTPSADFAAADPAAQHANHW